MKAIQHSIRIGRRLRPINSHGGFTLIELMVVVTIILLIAVMTAGAINLTIKGDKVRAAARQVQSFLAGARDRAIYSKAPRGVRFMLDPTNNRTVTSMVYIAPNDDWSQGTIEIAWIDGEAKGVKGFDNLSTCTNPTGWLNLYNQGLLKDGARIRIPNDNTGTWYSITTDYLAIASPDGSDGPNFPVLKLSTPYGKSPTANTSSRGNYESAFTTSDGPATYRLELPPSVMPNQEMVLFPRGTVIDLDRCNKLPGFPTPTTSTLPSAWMIGSGPYTYTSQMDIMFSPRGVVIGTAASRGVIEFYIADQVDADKQLMPEDPTGGDKVIMAVFTRTGGVSSHPVYLNSQQPTTINGTPVLDYFRYSETGEVAGK